MTKDILLVSQPAKQKGFHAMPPYGIFSVAGDLEAHGYEGRVGVIDGYLLSQQHDYREAVRIIVDAIKREKPISVGFGVYEPYTLDDWKMVKKVIRLGTSPSFGGTVASTDYKSYSIFGPVVKGEGEGAFRELNDRLFQEEPIEDVKGIAFFDGKEYVVTPRREPVDINKISLPAWHLLESLSEYNYKLPIETDRRCPYGCSFCNHYIIHQDIEKINQLIDEGNPIHPLSPSLKTLEKIRAEVETAREFGAKKLYLLGELVLLQRKRALGIGDIMAEYSSNWGINARSNLVVKQKRILPELKKEGLSWILVGVEAGSQAMLDLYNKQTTVKMNQKALNILYKLGIDAEVGYIPFNYFMNLDQLTENINFMYKNFLHFVSSRDYPYSLYAQWKPKRGTPLYAKALKEGLIKEIWDLKEGLQLSFKFKDPRVQKVGLLTEYYLRKYHQTTERLLEENYHNSKNWGIAMRLKQIPLDVLQIASVAVKHELDGVGVIDHFCQKQFQKLEQTISVIAK